MECRVHRLLFFWCVLAALEPTLAAASSYHIRCVGSLTNNTREDFIKLPLSSVDKNTKRPDQVNQCLEECFSKGFRYGALTDEPICYCATKFVGSETGCATERHGADNPNEGYKRNVIYEKADSKPTLSAISSENLGCYRDSPSSPVLDSYETTLTTVMTVELCLILCLNHGNHYAGVQAGNMCSCGDCCHNREGKLPDELCNITCEGDNTQMCGGDKSNRVYKLDFGCGEPPSLENAELIPNQQMKSSVVVYKCKKGYYKADGEEIMSCYWDNQGKSKWDNSSLLQCKKISKPQPVVSGVKGALIGITSLATLCGIMGGIYKVCKRRRDNTADSSRDCLTAYGQQEDGSTITPSPSTN